MSVFFQQIRRVFQIMTHSRVVVQNLLVAHARISRDMRWPLVRPVWVLSGETGIIVAGRRRAGDGRRRPVNPVDASYKQRHPRALFRHLVIGSGTVHERRTGVGGLQKIHLAGANIVDGPGDGDAPVAH